MAEEKNNRSEKLETLDHQIRDIINQWNEDPAQISDFLQFASKFSYSYSPRNTMLIQQQQSGAILCKSFQGCKKRRAWYGSIRSHTNHAFENC